jgi:Uma2 family endonuclease
MADRAFRLEDWTTVTPTEEEWASMTEDERDRVVWQLSMTTMSETELAPPEGVPHSHAKDSSLSALEIFFRNRKRKIFLGKELIVLYPGARRFCPDLFAVLDVEKSERQRRSLMSWVVAREGRGLDFVLEIHVGGNRKKDAVRNVAFYASLGIPEYFIYDRDRERLFGYRLAAPEDRTYQPILPQEGAYPSAVLGLELRIDGDRLRFYVGSARLPDADELIERLTESVAAIEARAEAQAARLEEETRALEEETRKREEETRKREEETRKREEETRKREEAERRVAELEAALARSRGGS